MVNDMAKRKYFILNKDTDYKNGYMENVESNDDGISILGNYTITSDEEEYDEDLQEEELVNQNQGNFISKVLDSCTEKTTWHRMTIDTDDIDHTELKIFIYASNENFLEYTEGRVGIEEVIKDEELTISEKKAIFHPFLKKTISNSMDMLLHEVEGRYLWFIVEMYKRDNKFFRLNNFKVSFPKETWTRYLPEIYSEGTGKNAFLERYLSIFQSLYEDLNEEIKDSVSKLDPSSTTEEYLRTLAEWFAIDNIQIWNDEQLRYIIKNMSYLYGKRGTREGISNFVKVYTGESPIIVEHQDFNYLKDNIYKYDLACKLYKNDPYVFTVLVKEEHVPSNKEYKTLVKIIENVKPAYMEFDLVILKPYIFLNNYTYMGVNTVLGRYKTLSLDGFSLVPFSTIKNDKE